MKPMEYEWIGRESRKIRHQIIRKIIYKIRALKTVIDDDTMPKEFRYCMKNIIKSHKEQIKEVWEIYENENFWS